MDAPGLSKLGDLDNMQKLKDIIKKTAATEKQDTHGDEEGPRTSYILLVPTFTPVKRYMRP